MKSALADPKESASSMAARQFLYSFISLIRLEVDQQWVVVSKGVLMIMDERNALNQSAEQKWVLSFD